MNDLFSRTELIEILGTARTNLQYLESRGIFTPAQLFTNGNRKIPFYNFQKILIYSLYDEMKNEKGTLEKESVQALTTADKMIETVDDYLSPKYLLMLDTGSYFMSDDTEASKIILESEGSKIVKIIDWQTHVKKVHQKISELYPDKNLPELKSFQRELVAC